MEDKNKLYSFIYPNSNDQISNFSGSDLCELFDQINSNNLDLRTKLNLDNLVTFGLEIESEYAEKEEIIKLISQLNRNWIIGEDLSLKRGVEVKSPIMNDGNKSWVDLKNVCSIMANNSKIGERAGGHIHIGTQILGGNIDAWINFIKLWGVYENIIFRFVSGEFLTLRPSMERYAESLSEEFLKQYNNLSSKNETLYALLNKFQCRNDRMYAVNFANVLCSKPEVIKDRNTIEFRCPNGTLNPIIWQNNVNFFVKMLNYSKNSKYNGDTIDKRYNLISKYDLKLKDYDEIYLEQALELCDLIFDNNLDKIYFLKQYLKSFEVYNDFDNYIDTKRKIFTK